MSTHAPDAPVKSDVKDFTIAHDVLADAVAKVSRSAGNTGDLSRLRLVFANSRLTVSASDLELGATAKIPVTGKHGARAFVDAKLFGKVLGSIAADEVTLTVAKSTVTLKADGYVAEFASTKGDTFALPHAPDTAAVKVNAVEFLAGAAAVSGAAASGDERPILTGVHLTDAAGSLAFTATDSYRLARAITPVPALGSSVLVPKRALVELSRMVGDADEIDVSYDERSVLFVVGERQLVAQLIEGEFPAVDQLVPDASKLPTAIAVNRLDTLAALRRVALMSSDDQNHAVKITANTRGIVLTAVSASGADEVGQAREPIDGSYTGEKATVAYNAKYLAAGLASFDEDELTLSVQGDGRPDLLHAGSPGERFYLLMPVKIGTAEAPQAVEDPESDDDPEAETEEATEGADA